MDNSGAATGESSKESTAATNPFEGGVVDNFGVFVEGRPDLRPDTMEQPTIGGEAMPTPEAAETAGDQMMSLSMPEQQAAAPSHLDAATASEGAPTDTDLRALTETAVPRDVEELPKAYMDHVVKIINKNKQNPHQLVADLDVARWDMMKKAFNRNRGDGK